MIGKTLTTVQARVSGHLAKDHVAEIAKHHRLQASPGFLAAAQYCQQRFEELLEKRKAGELSAGECREYEAICQLDDALTWLNRLARRSPSES